MTTFPEVPRWALGDAVIYRIDELPMPPETGSWLLPTVTDEHVGTADWLRPDYIYLDGTLRLAIHSFAMQVGGRRVIVDTGVGNGKTRASPAWNDLDTDFLTNLTKAGFPPESIDAVIVTHMHTDHVGWNTRRGDDGSWVPTFPNARYLTSQAEYDYWSSVDMDDARHQIFLDSIWPIRESGQLDLIEVARNGVEVIADVTLIPAPGHTPGQVAVRIEGGARTAITTGDWIHHPVQLAHPTLTSSADVDPALAIRTRQALLAEIAETNTLLLGTHFPPPTAGLVRRNGDGYRLVAVPGEMADRPEDRA